MRRNGGKEDLCLLIVERDRGLQTPPVEVVGSLVLSEKMINVPEIEEQVGVIRRIISLIVQEESLLIGFDRVLEVPFSRVNRFENLKDVTEGLVEIFGLPVDGDRPENERLRLQKRGLLFKISEGEA